MDKLFSDHRLTLEDPASDGGGGGGGGAPTPPEPASPDPIHPPEDEAPPRSAREAIYEKIESLPPDSTPKAELKAPEAPEPQKEAPAPVKADSAEPPRQDGKAPTAEEIASKRVADAQAALTRKSMEAAADRKGREEAESKLNRVKKYVDFEKLDTWEKEQEEATLDQPVTRRDLKEREDADRAARQQDEVLAERSKRIDQFLTKHPHVKQYMDSGELFGVGDRMQLENPGASWEDIADKTAEFFRERDAKNRAAIQRDLTTRREALGGAGMPRAAGDMPADSPSPGPVDTSVGAAVRERQDRLNRQRTLI